MCWFKFIYTWIDFFPSRDHSERWGGVVKIQNKNDEWVIRVVVELDVPFSSQIREWNDEFWAPHTNVYKSVPASLRNPLFGSVFHCTSAFPAQSGMFFQGLFSDFMCWDTSQLRGKREHGGVHFYFFLQRIMIIIGKIAKKSCWRTICSTKGCNHVATASAWSHQAWAS